MCAARTGVHCLAALTLAVSIIIALPSAAAAEQLVLWGFKADHLEVRMGKGKPHLAWETETFVGTDSLKLAWRSEGEVEFDTGDIDELANEARLQFPVSEFFDASVGVRANTPPGMPSRFHAVLGLQGLARQWLELDASLYLSNRPFFRFKAEYEGLITNRLILTPSVELDLPMADDRAFGSGAWGPKLELGARLSYDVIDRMVSPYVGVHYERSFGRSSSIARSAGGHNDAVYLVVGTRFIF